MLLKLWKKIKFLAWWFIHQQGENSSSGDNHYASVACSRNSLKMLKGVKIILIFFGYLCSTMIIADDGVNFQNISIQSDEVIIDKKDRLLTFKDNIKIKIENYVIEGSNALFKQKDEKLEIFGKPTSIKSTKMDGEAEVLVIYPNKSIDLIGSAKLKKNGNLITSDLITYQINANE